MNEKLLNWLPQYFAQFDSPITWEGDTCINTAMNGQYKVKLVLTEVVIGGVVGCTPSISIWDGTNYVEQTEWPGEINNYLGHIVGSCGRVIAEHAADQPWVFMVVDKHQRVPYTLATVLNKRAGVGYSETNSHYGIGRRAKANRPYNLIEILTQYETTHYRNRPPGAELSMVTSQQKGG